MKTCLTGEELATYVDGSADAALLRRAVEHLASCAECRDREKSLARISRGLAQSRAAETEPPEELVQSAILAIYREGPTSSKVIKRWLLLPAAAVVAIVAWFAIVHLSPVGAVVFSQDESVVIDGGKGSVGDSFRAGSRLVLFGNSQIIVGDDLVRSSSVRTILAINGTPAEPVISLIGGSVFVESGSDESMPIVLTKDGRYVARGTKFEVGVLSEGGSQVRVVEGEVVAEVDGQAKTVRAGHISRFASGAPVVEPIPETAASVEHGARVPVPSLATGADWVDAQPDPMPLRGETIKVLARLERQAVRNSSEPKPLVEMAVLFTQVEQRPAAGAAVREALSREPELSWANDEQLWAIVRGQVSGDSEYRGDNATARRLLDILDARGSRDKAYRDAWRTIATHDYQGAVRLTWAELNDAVAVLRSFDRRDDRLQLAQVLRLQTAEATGDTEVKSATMRAARDLFQEVIADGMSGLTPEQRAAAWYGLGEARWYEQLHPGAEYMGSLAAQREAIKAWPVPRWSVHVASRMVERYWVPEGTPFSRAEIEGLVSELRTGLRGDPSFYAYRRAISALLAVWNVNFADAASSPGRDKWRTMLEELADWNATTFSAFWHAHAQAADVLNRLGLPDKAGNAIDRAADLAGGPENLGEYSGLWNQLIGKTQG